MSKIFLQGTNRTTASQLLTLGFLFSLLLTSVERCTANDEIVGYDLVKEILRKRCVTCHNPDEMRGDLDLKDLTAIKAGSASGPVVVAKDSAASLLYTTVAHLEDPVMPPNSSRIPEREQDLIRRWIDGGLAEKSDSQASMAKPIDRPPSEGRLSQVRALPQASAVRFLTGHPQRDLVATAGLKQVVLLEPKSNKFLGAIDVSGDVSALRFSRDGKLLLVAVSQPAVSGTVVAFEVEHWNEVWRFGDETDAILAIDLSIDGKTLAFGGPAKAVRLIDVQSGTSLHSLKKHTDWILDMQFSPDGLLLASSDRFGSIIVWDPKEGKVFQNLKDHVGAVQALAWDVDSETLISAGEDGLIRTWNMHHGDMTSKWDAEVGAVMALTRSKQFIATTGRKNQLSVWRSADHLVGKLGLMDQGESLCLQAEGDTLLLGDASGQISQINPHNLQLVQQTNLPVDSALLAQLLDKIESQHANYLTQAKKTDFAKKRSDKAAPQIERNQPNGSTTPWISQSKSEDESNVSGSSDRSATASISGTPGFSDPHSIQTQTAVNQQLIVQTQNSLQSSSQSLLELSKLNDELIRMVTRSSQVQQQIAQQIAEQAKLLELLQDRQRQLEENSKITTEQAPIRKAQQSVQSSSQKK